MLLLLLILFLIFETGSLYVALVGLELPEILLPLNPSIGVEGVGCYTQQNSGL